MRAALVTLALVLTLPVPARAGQTPPPGEATQLAKMHFSLGRAYVQRRQYEDAIREFETGYGLRPLPLFLYNIGQVARLAGLHEKALDALEHYLRTEPKAADRAEVERWIASLKKTIAEDKAKAASDGAAPGSVPSTVSTALLAPADPAPPPSPALTPPPAPAADAAPPRRSRRTLWIVLGSVGGALLVGGAITAGVLATRSGSGVPDGFHNLGVISLGH